MDKQQLLQTALERCSIMHLAAAGIPTTGLYPLHHAYMRAGLSWNAAFLRAVEEVAPHLFVDDGPPPLPDPS